MKDMQSALMTVTVLYIWHSVSTETVVTALKERKNKHLA